MLSIPLTQVSPSLSLQLCHTYWRREEEEEEVQVLLAPLHTAHSFSHLPP